MMECARTSTEVKDDAIKGGENLGRTERRIRNFYLDITRDTKAIRCHPSIRLSPCKYLLGASNASYNSTALLNGLGLEEGSTF